MSLTATRTSTYDPTVLAGGDAAVIADLARRAAEEQTIDAETAADNGLLIRVHRDDEKIGLVDLEKYRSSPHAPRGTANLHRPTAFAEYVKRQADDLTTLWADRDANRITAVFNDHDGVMPGWRDHTAVFRAALDPDWEAWASRSGKLMSQEAFAEFIEDHYDVIIRPSAADMLEVAQTFQARRSASFERATRLQNGDVQLRFHEETTATAGTKGNIDVPTEFVVNLAPYIGNDPTEVLARLRYRIREGNLAIGFVLHRPDDLLRRAFDLLVEYVKTGLGDTAAPIFYGSAPAALRQ